MNENFYALLPAFDDFRQFSTPAHYVALPDDWWVVITDVQGSTRAIESGRYKDVNALGAASIMALLNAVKPLKIPYVFGGDGALVCIPKTAKDNVLSALIGTRAMAEKSFGLILRTGLVEMKTIKEAGREILIGKYRPTPYYEQAMFRGDVLEYAESLVKGLPPNPYLLDDQAATANADFTGFECRWNEVPSVRGETVAVLIKALNKDHARADALYEKLLDEIWEIYGREQDHHPLRPDKMRTALSFRTLSAEIRIKGWRKALLIFFYAAVGRWLMWKKTKTSSTDWGHYKQTVIENTDFRKFDGALRMIISGTHSQRQLLRNLLEEHRQKGELVFGLHRNPAALITCLISNYDHDHVHFVDGSTGGYALAAKELKEQLKHV